MPSGGVETPIPANVFARLAAATRFVISGAGPESWFGPQQPLQPQAPPEVKGRQWDYPFGVNINYVPRSDTLLSFAELRTLADALPLLRAVIETRKDQIAALNWTISGGARAGAVRAFLERPDRRHDFATWLRMLIEDMLVIDAACVYPRFDRSGALYSLDVVDGATIKPLISEDGRAPEPPDPAYQQVLHGVPAADFGFDELLYLPRNARSHRLYGFSPVEQIALTINVALRREQATLDYYNTGSVPDSFATLPKEWTVDQIRQFQDYFDALMSGNLARRRMVKFMPAEFKLTETRQPPLKDMYDEWLARVICYAFSVPASAFISQVNRATSETLRTQATTEGLAPLKSWVKRVIDRAIAVGFAAPDCEFNWVGDDGVDPLQQAQTISILVGAGVKTVAEARAELGLGRGSGVAKFNPYHDERGRFTDAEGAVEPGAQEPKRPDRGVDVADNNENSPTMTDAGVGRNSADQVAQVPPIEPPPIPEPVTPIEPPAAPPDAAPPNEIEAQPKAPTSAAADPKSPVDQTLVQQLVAAGVKITPENVLATGIAPNGTIVWIESGDANSGLQHIIQEHGSEFNNIGVPASAIPRVLMSAIAEGNVIGYQGQGVGRPIFQTTINGQRYNIAITIGDNGYIVGANLRGRAQ